MTTVVPADYTTLLGDIKQRIRSAQYEALKGVTGTPYLFLLDVWGLELPLPLFLTSN